MLLSSLLFLFVSFSTSKFDKYEKVHSNLENCPDGDPNFLIDLNKQYIDCSNIQNINFPITGPVTISRYMFSGSDVTSVTFSKDVTNIVIKEGAFSYCTELKSFTIPQDVTSLSIEDGSFFKCINLQSIEFPSSTGSIGESAFESCDKLEPNFASFKNVDIGPYAFYNCKNIKQISDLKTGTGSIGDYAFAIPKLKLSKAIQSTQVGDYSFYQCEFDDLEIDCNKVGVRAFEGTGSIKSFKTTTGCTFKDYAFSGHKLPTPLKFSGCTFGPYVFANCDLTAVEEITITGNIPGYCFANSKTNSQKICTVTLENGNIGKHSFEGFGQLSLELIENSNGLKIEEYAFYRSGLKGSLFIPNTYSEIGTRAFALTNFEKLTIDSAQIGTYAFQDCEIKKSIRIIGSTICESAFEGCRAFSELVIGYEKTDIETVDDNTITEDNPFSECTINKRAFYGVTISGKLYIHSCINIIDEYAFATSTISDVTIYAAHIKPFAFSNAGTISNLKIFSRDIEFHAFDGCKIGKLVIDYKDPLYFAEDKKNFEDPSIREQAFYGLTIADLEISQEYIIYKSAFQSCDFKGSLKIHAKEIGSFAFASCKSDSCTVEIGNCSISSHAFTDFKNINTLSFVGTDTCTIGDYAFIGSEIKNEKGLTFPSSVTTIGKGAFANITSLVPSKLTIESKTIDDFAFEGCSKIQLFELKEGVRHIGEKAFSKTGLNCDFVIPRSVTEINSRSFEDLNLGKITLYSDSELTHIGESAFVHSTIKGQLQIPFNVETIEGSAFRGCKELDSLMFYYGSSLNSIGEYAFADCSNIDCNLDIPSKVTEIGDYAFANCGNIKGHITLSLLCKVGKEAFQNCNQIKSISIKTYVDDDGSNTEIKENSFKNMDVFGSIIIPQSIEEIGDSAFEGCKYITDIEFKKDEETEEIQSTLLKIGNRAFYQTGISKFIIPKSVTEIGVSAFEGCQKLKNLFFEDRINNKFSIGSLAFSSSGLELIYGDFPSQASIGDHAFANCLGLKSIDIYGGSFGAGILQGCTNTYITIDIEGACIIGESAFEGLVTPSFTLSISSSVPNTIDIGNRAFYGSSIQFKPGITFSKAVSNIGREAFSHCQNIKGYLTLNGAKVGEGSFSYSSFEGALKILADPGYSFGESTFRGCSGFSSLVISGLEKVPARAFYGMSFFKNTLKIPAKCTFIGEYAFAGCGFSKIEFLGDDPNDQTKRTKDIDIERGAFSGIPTMFEIEIPPLLKPTTRSDPELSEMRDFMFYECTSLSSFNLKSYNKIGKYAFYGCKNLNMKLDFTNIKSIGTGAFQGCSSLTGSIEIPVDLTRIEDNAFADCTGLSDSLTINVNGATGFTADYTKIGAGAFKGCTGFKKGSLTIFIEKNEISSAGDSFYKYGYFLRIGHDAFKDCKFKNIYYNGRYEPDCDYDLGISHTKAIHTSSNYVNKSFCSYPLHHDKLSGGAIAGITIAVIVVVAAIVVLVVYLIIRNKRNKDQSEAEVEMNADP